MGCKMFFIRVKDDVSIIVIIIVHLMQPRYLVRTDVSLAELSSR